MYTKIAERIEVAEDGGAAPAEVVVYSQPCCMQCRMTYRALEGKGVPYRVVDLSENDEALAYVSGELGYSMAPVVVVSDSDHWAGFRPDEIERVAAELQADAAEVRS